MPVEGNLRLGIDHTGHTRREGDGVLLDIGPTRICTLIRQRRTRRSEEHHNLVRGECRRQLRDIELGAGLRTGRAITRMVSKRGLLDLDRLRVECIRYCTAGADRAVCHQQCEADYSK